MNSSQPTQPKKFAWPMDGEAGLENLFRTFANHISRPQVSAIPRCRFDFTESLGFHAKIDWNDASKSASISMSFGLLLHAANVCMWIVSRGARFTGMRCPPHSVYDDAYSDEERTMWNPTLVIDRASNSRCFVPRYMRMQQGGIDAMLSLLKPAACFILSHEIGHFVTGHCHAESTRDRSSSIGMKDDQRTYGETAKPPDQYRQAIELQADFHAAATVFGRAYFMSMPRLPGNSMINVADSNNISEYSRHLEVSFLTIAAILMTSNEGPYHPSGEVRVFNLMYSLVQCATVQGVREVFPREAFTDSLMAKLIEGLHELGSLFGRRVPHSDDYLSPRRDRSHDSARDKWQHLQTVLKEHSHMLDPARRLAHDAIGRG